MRKSEALFYRRKIEEAAQSLPDAEAMTVKSLYPTFENIIGKTVSKGFKFTYSGYLWSVVQETITIQAHYPPSDGTESLYTRIDEQHDGTKYGPIPYSGNMALEEGKYYIQSGKTYLCNRDTGNPVYHALAELAGLYVTEVTT